MMLKRQLNHPSSGGLLIEAAIAIPVLILIFLAFIEGNYLLKRYIALNDAILSVSRTLSLPFDPDNPLETGSLSKCNNVASAEFIKQMGIYGEILSRDDFEVSVTQTSMKKLLLKGTLQMDCTVCARVLGFKANPFKVDFSRDILLEGDNPFCEVES